MPRQLTSKYYQCCSFHSNSQKYFPFLWVQQPCGMYFLWSQGTCHLSMMHTLLVNWKPQNQEEVTIIATKSKSIIKNLLTRSAIECGLMFFNVLIPNKYPKNDVSTQFCDKVILFCCGCCGRKSNGKVGYLLRATKPMGGKDYLSSMHTQDEFFVQRTWCN